MHYVVAHSVTGVFEPEAQIYIDTLTIHNTSIMPTPRRMYLIRREDLYTKLSFLTLSIQLIGDICVNVNDNVWIVNKEEMDYTTLPQLIAPQTSLEYDCKQPLSFFLRKHKVDQPGMHHGLSRLIESIHH